MCVCLLGVGAVGSWDDNGNLCAIFKMLKSYELNSGSSGIWTRTSWSTFGSCDGSTTRTFLANLSAKEPSNLVSIKSRSIWYGTLIRWDILYLDNVNINWRAECVAMGREVLWNETTVYVPETIFIIWPSIPYYNIIISVLFNISSVVQTLLCGKWHQKSY